MKTNSINALAKHDIPLPKYEVGQLVAITSYETGKIVVGIISGLEYRARMIFGQEKNDACWYYTIWWSDESITLYRPWTMEEQVGHGVDMYEEMVMKSLS